MFHMLGTN